MRITINGKGMRVGDQLKQRIREKLSKFNRFFGDEAQATVKVRPERDQKCIEVTLKINKHFYRAECTADDVFTALDEAIEVLEGQIRKHKTKIEKKIHDYAYMKEYLKTQEPVPGEVEEEFRIIKRKSFNMSRWMQKRQFSRWKCWNTASCFTSTWILTKSVSFIKEKMGITA